MCIQQCTFSTSTLTNICSAAEVCSLFLCLCAPRASENLQPSCFRPKSYVFHFCHLCQYCLLCSITQLGRSSATKMNGVFIYCPVSGPHGGRTQRCQLAFFLLSFYCCFLHRLFIVTRSSALLLFLFNYSHRILHFYCNY